MADEKVLLFRVGPQATAGFARMIEGLTASAREDSMSAAAVFGAIAGQAFDARAIALAALATIPQPSIAEIVAGIMRDAQGQAAIAGRLMHNWTLGIEGRDTWGRKEQSEVRDLGEIG